MNTAVEFQSQTIITRSRGFLNLLTFGNWQRICTLDFSSGILEEKTKRLAAIISEKYPLKIFDAVDCSYELVASQSEGGMTQEWDEFRVGLRFASNGLVFPLAAFRGHTTTSSGLSAVIESFLPASWNSQNIRHELEARSLANLLCDKLDLGLS